MLCYSGGGFLSIKASNFPVHQQRQQVHPPNLVSTLNINLYSLLSTHHLGVCCWVQWLKNLLSLLLFYDFNWCASGQRLWLYTVNGILHIHCDSVSPCSLPLWFSIWKERTIGKQWLFTYDVQCIHVCSVSCRAHGGNWHWSIGKLTRLPVWESLMETGEC